MKIPPDTAAGAGSLSRITEILEREGAAKVLVCTDKGVSGAGLTDKLLDALKGNAAEVQVMDDLATEPSYGDVDRAVSKLTVFPDLIIALGGGSVMDAAKLLSVLCGADYSTYNLVQEPGRAKKQIRTVMIPTTCGTGAEATCNAIVAIPERGIKSGIVSNEMIPDHVILDPMMIAGLPRSIVASTGIDALCHVVECFTSNKATPLSDVYAAAGSKLIFRNIKQALDDPEDTGAREAMLIGAFCGGAAITASGTTAVHALSYPLGGKFHIAHGVSNAILFAPVMRVNMGACQHRLARLSDIVWPERFGLPETEKAAGVVETIGEIVKYAGIPCDLTGFGVTLEHLDFLVDEGFQQKRLLNNNIKVLTKDEIRDIYKTVLK